MKQILQHIYKTQSLLWYAYILIHTQCIPAKVGIKSCRCAVGCISFVHGCTQLLNCNWIVFDQTHVVSIGNAGWLVSCLLDGQLATCFFNFVTILIPFLNSKFIFTVSFLLFMVYCSMLLKIFITTKAHISYMTEMLATSIISLRWVVHVHAWSYNINQDVHHKWRPKETLIYVSHLLHNKCFLMVVHQSQLLYTYGQLESALA